MIQEIEHCSYTSGLKTTIESKKEGTHASLTAALSRATVSPGGSGRLHLTFVLKGGVRLGNGEEETVRARLTAPPGLGFPADSGKRKQATQEKTVPLTRREGGEFVLEQEIMVSHDLAEEDHLLRVSLEYRVMPAGSPTGQAVSEAIVAVVPCRKP